MNHHSLLRRHHTQTMVCAVAILSITACGGGAAGGTATAAPEQSAPARFVYGPFSAVYEVVSTVYLDQGPVGTSNFKIRYYLSATAEHAEGASRLTLTIDSVTQATGPTVSSTDVAGAPGTRFTGTLSSRGEIMGFQGEETGNQLVDQLREGLSRFFPRIPPGGASPGATWSDSLSTDSPAGDGVNIHITLRTQYEALDWGEYNGTQALHVRTTAEYSLSGGGSSMGADFTVDGAGRRYGELFLGADGIFLGGVSADTSESTADVPAAGMSIPITQIRADTIRVIR